MRNLLLVCLAMAAMVGVQGFLGAGIRPSAITATRRGDVLMVKDSIPQSVVSTRAGKAERVEQYKTWLEDADLIFAIPSFNLTVKEVTTLRNKMPQGTQVHVAKNTLLRLAAKDSGFQSVSPKLEGANLWFFVKEDNIQDTFKAYNAFLKEAKKDKSHLYKFGVFEGSLLDVEGVKSVSELPSKAEIYARLVHVLKEPPQQLASLLQMGGGNLLQVLQMGLIEGKEKPAEEEVAA